MSDRSEDANARLIAAAPDLLARLEASTAIMIGERDCFYESVSLPDGEVDDEDDARQLAEMDADIAANQAAIAKAKGEG